MSNEDFPCCECRCCIKGLRADMYDVEGKRSKVCMKCGHLVTDHLRKIMNHTANAGR
jgi:hypothetical protein